MLSMHRPERFLRCRVVAMLLGISERTIIVWIDHTLTLNLTCSFEPSYRVPAAAASGSTALAWPEG
jgi:predicted DNA-binding transcriptional regulator AlpA